MSKAPKKRQREPSPDASLTTRIVIFSNGNVEAHEKMPSVNELHYYVIAGNVPRWCTKIGIWFPNVTTFKYHDTRRNPAFQASFVENVPTLRQFIFKSHHNYTDEENIAAFIHANPQLTRLELCGESSDQDSVQSVIEWNKLQNITELTICGESLTEQRIADLTNLRKLTFAGIDASAIYLDDFVFERLEDLEAKDKSVVGMYDFVFNRLQDSKKKFAGEGPRVDEDVIEVIKKNGGNLKKLKISFGEDSELVQLPRYLPQLKELCLTSHSLCFKDKGFGVNLIAQFILNCCQLSSIFVGYWDNRKTSDFLESIKQPISCVGRDKWTVTTYRRILRKKSKFCVYYEIRIEKMK